MSLLSTQKLRDKLGLTDSSGVSDAELSDLITAVTALIRTYLGYNPETTSYTADLSPVGGATLALDAPPVPVTVTAVYEDADRVFGSDTMLTAGTDYVQTQEQGEGRGELVRLNTVWRSVVRRQPDRLAGTIQPEQKTVRVTYTADTTLALAVAKRACLMECLAQWNAGGNGIGVVVSDAMDGAAVSVNPNGRPRSRPDSLDGFVSPLVAPMLSPFAKIRGG